MQEKCACRYQKGMTFTTEQLEYRSVPGLVVSNHPVKVVDGRLTLTAQGMEMSLHDEKARFMGLWRRLSRIHGKVERILVLVSVWLLGVLPDRGCFSAGVRGAAATVTVLLGPSRSRPMN